MSDLSFNISGAPGGQGSLGPTGPLTRTGAASSAAPITPANATPPLDGDGRLDRRITGDRVEVSNFARYLEKLRRLPDARLSRVNAARKAIAAGAYDDQRVLEATIQRMSEEEF